MCQSAQPRPRVRSTQAKTGPLFAMQFQQSLVEAFMERQTPRKPARTANRPSSTTGTTLRRPVGSTAGLAALLRASAGAAVSLRTGRRLRPTVGLDLISVTEVASSLDRFGERYVRRVYTDEETAYCRSASGAASAARFAVRFAAKEAAVKALEPDHEWTRWRDIEVRRHKSGRCTLVLHGHAATLARRRGIRSFALSMTHDRDHAAAIVLAWRHADATSGRLTSIS